MPDEYGFVEIVARIETLASSDEHFSELAQQIRRLLALAPRSIGSQFGAGTKIHRETAHHVGIPSRIEEIWFPPAEIIKNFGRANRPARSVFYGCFDPLGAFLEARANIGQYAIWAEWETTAPMRLHDVGYSDAVLTRAGSDKDLAPAHREFDARLEPDARQVRDHLALLFTEPSPAHYRVTAAIAEIFMEGLDGIKYPSVANRARAHNVALRPDFVRSSLRLATAQLVHIDHVDHGNVKGHTVARLGSVNDGVMTWESTGSNVTTIKRGTPTELRIEPGQKKRFGGEAGRRQINGRTYDVLP